MYQFCTRIQVKQIKTEIINKDGEKDFPRISGNYFIQKIVHTTIYTRKSCGRSETSPTSIFNEEAYMQ